MNQPQKLNLPNGYPGSPYSATVSVQVAGGLAPVASVRLRYERSGRQIGLSRLQPTVTVLNDLSNPNAWRVKLDFSADATADLPRLTYVELLINGHVYTTGNLIITYQNR